VATRSKMILRVGSPRAMRAGTAARWTGVLIA
jgi:hypothetical protein